MGLAFNTDVSRAIASSTRWLALHALRANGIEPIVLTRGRHSIGHAENCRVRLDVEGISSQHAVIVVGTERVVIRAWDPRTWIDEGPIREATLRVGQRLTIGPITFQVRLATDDEVLAAVVVPGAVQENHANRETPSSLESNSAGERPTVSIDDAPVRFMDAAELANTLLPELAVELWDASAGVSSNVPTDAATGGLTSPEVDPAGIVSADDPQPEPSELLAAWDELRMAQETFARESADRRIAMSLDARSLHALRTRLTTSLQNVEHRSATLERAAKLLEQRTNELEHRALDLDNRDRQLAAERDRLEAAAANARREVTAQLEQHQASWREWNETHDRMAEQLQQQVRDLDERRREFAQEAADWQAAQHNVLHLRAAVEAAQAEVALLRETLSSERGAWEFESRQLNEELTRHRQQVEIHESSSDSLAEERTRFHAELTQQQRQLLKDRAELDATRASLTLQQQQTAEHAAHQQSEWDLQWANLRAAQELLIAERAAFATEQSVWEEARRQHVAEGLVPSFLAQLELAEPPPDAAAPVTEQAVPDEAIIPESIPEKATDESVEDSAQITESALVQDVIANEPATPESFTPAPFRSWSVDDTAPSLRDEQLVEIDVAARVRDLTEQFAAEEAEAYDQPAGLTPWQLDAYSQHQADVSPQSPYDPGTWDGRADLTDAYRHAGYSPIADHYDTPQGLDSGLSTESPEEASEQPADPVSSLRSELARMFDLPGLPQAAPEEPANEPVTENNPEAAIEPETPAVQDDWRSRLNALMATETAPTPAPVVEAPIVQPPVAAHAPQQATDTTDDDGDSIAAYMERLLARTRGEAPATSSSPTSRPVEQTVVETLPTSQRDSSEKAAETQAAVHVVRDQSHLQAEPKHRVNKDEARAHLASFREVANMSARKAVATYSWQSTRSELTLKLVIGVLCGLGTIVFLTGVAWQGMNQSLQGLACLIGAGWMLWDIQRSATKLRRLQRFVGPNSGTMTGDSEEPSESTAEGPSDGVETSDTASDIDLSPTEAVDAEMVSTDIPTIEHGSPDVESGLDPAAWSTRRNAGEDE